MASVNENNPDRLNQTIAFLKHTSHMVELFSDKHAIYHINDTRLQNLHAALHFFSEWKEQSLQTRTHVEFISDKLWFDLQSMILGFISLVGAKLARFPGTIRKPSIMNRDIVENHFSQLRAANGQNENPTYLLNMTCRKS